MWFLSHNCRVTWPSALTVEYKIKKSVAAGVEWLVWPKCRGPPLQVTHLWHCVLMTDRKNNQTRHAADQQKTASEQMPERRLLWCQQLTPKAHAGSERELDIGPSNKSVVRTDPWGDQFAPPPLPGLSAGLNRGQRAGHSSGWLRNVSLTGCKDKQITRPRRGPVVVMSHRFTPGSLGL